MLSLKVVNSNTAGGEMFTDEILFNHIYINVQTFDQIAENLCRSYQKITISSDQVIHCIF